MWSVNFTEFWISFLDAFCFIHNFRFRSLYELDIQNLSNRCSNKCVPSISRNFEYHFWRVFCFLAQLASVSLVSSLKENGLKRWECSQWSEPRAAVLHTVSMYYVSLYTVYLCALSWVYIPLRPFILFPYILSFLEERVHTLLYQLSWEWLRKVFKGWLWCYFIKWQEIVSNHKIIMRVMCRSHENSFNHIRTSKIINM